MNGQLDVSTLNIAFAQECMGIRLDNKDPTGTYCVEVKVHDYIKRVEFALIPITIRNQAIWLVLVGLWHWSAGCLNPSAYHSTALHR